MDKNLCVKIVWGKVFVIFLKSNVFLFSKIF